MSASIRFACPACDTRLQASDAKIGKSFPCPKCTQTVRVPGPAQEVIRRATPPQLPPIVLPPIVPAPMYEPQQQFYTQPPLQQAPLMQQNTVVNIQSPPRESHALAALLNFLFPSIGYLIQGRIGSFFLYWLTMVLILIGGVLTVGLAWLLAPMIWIYSIVDAANYRSR
ncbi:hypothetical protein [Planctomicrobium sp. SH664]|uniref:hypothetical protein n=1 Tax=Planctomicrobium sp. SH664 TaxID=3448125 RepID=UPI003F5BC5E0